MTTVFKSEVRCGVCEEASEHYVVGSTNMLGSMDLDTRPPEMARSTMPYWVQRCPHCGYCAPDISKGALDLAPVLHSEGYLGQSFLSQHPELARLFLCEALLCEHTGDFRQAFKATLSAAWTCDDAQSLTLARSCRQLALFRMQKVGEPIFPQRGADEVLKADLLRRIGNLETVQEVCDAGLDKLQEDDDIVRHCLEFEKHLASIKDESRYTVGNAVKYSTGSNGVE